MPMIEHSFDIFLNDLMQSPKSIDKIKQYLQQPCIIRKPEYHDESILKDEGLTLPHLIATRYDFNDNPGAVGELMDLIDNNCRDENLEPFDWNAHDIDGYTPLHFAALSGFHVLIEILFVKHSELILNINQTTFRYDYTPLHLTAVADTVTDEAITSEKTAKMNQAKLETAKKLLDYGAQLLKDKHNCLPGQGPCRLNPIKSLLAEKFQLAYNPHILLSSRTTRALSGDAPMPKKQKTSNRQTSSQS